MKKISQLTELLGKKINKTASALHQLDMKWGSRQEVLQATRELSHAVCVCVCKFGVWSTSGNSCVVGRAVLQYHDGPLGGCSVGGGGYLLLCLWWAWLTPPRPRCWRGCAARPGSCSEAGSWRSGWSETRRPPSAAPQSRYRTDPGGRKTGSQTAVSVQGLHPWRAKLDYTSPKTVSQNALHTAFFFLKL